jgi:hypothetical protein
VKLCAQLSGPVWQFLPWPWIGYWCSSWYWNKTTDMRNADSKSTYNESHLCTVYYSACDNTSLFWNGRWPCYLPTSPHGIIIQKTNMNISCELTFEKTCLCGLFSVHQYIQVVTVYITYTPLQTVNRICTDCSSLRNLSCCIQGYIHANNFTIMNSSGSYSSDSFHHTLKLNFMNIIWRMWVFFTLGIVPTKFVPVKLLFRLYSVKW